VFKVKVETSVTPFRFACALQRAGQGSITVWFHGKDNVYGFMHAFKRARPIVRSIEIP